METREMDWSHSSQAIRQRYTTSLNLEPTGEKDKRPTVKNMGWRHDPEADVKETGYNWGQFERLTQGRNA